MGVLHPQECYLLESFISVEHYAKTRDAIIAYIDAHEAALARYKKEMPLNVRRLPLWEQADVVWETRVMPNLRPARERYIKAYILRTHNDIKAFNIGDMMSNVNKGISEFWDNWMTEEERQNISNLFSIAYKLDDRLSTTIWGGWEDGNLTYKGKERIYNPNELPAQIPRYELDFSVRIEIDDSPVKTGFYLPDIDFAPARFIPADFGEPPEARQGVKRSDWVNPDTGKRDYSWEESEWAKTGWTLIRRVENEFIDVPPEGFFPQGLPEELYDWSEREKQLLQKKQKRITAQSGEISPHTGRWGTLVNGSIDYAQVKQGQPLPEFEDKHGKSHQTVWSLLERDDKGSVYIDVV
ncbi:MAG: type VI secretion protein ImpA [Enterobacteriaceae bacterium]|nr:type VI secretion protein ImpA [Enterobacteriaceae bacterium]